MLQQPSSYRHIAEPVYPCSNADRTKLTKILKLDGARDLDRRRVNGDPLDRVSTRRKLNWRRRWHPCLDTRTGRLAAYWAAAANNKW